MWRTDSLEKTLMLGRIEGKEEKERTEDEMVGWHHQFNGHEFEQALGDGKGQGGLACCSPWGRKESNMTERLNSNNKLEGYRFPSSQLWYYSMILFHFRIQAEGAPPVYDLLFSWQTEKSKSWGKHTIALKTSTWNWNFLIFHWPE